jgi:hypothetical protein
MSALGMKSKATGGCCAAGIRSARGSSAAKGKADPAKIENGTS